VYAAASSARGYIDGRLGLSGIREPTRVISAPKVAKILTSQFGHVQLCGGETGFSTSITTVMA
jgi:hypothetical protein